MFKFKLIIDCKAISIFEIKLLRAEESSTKQDFVVELDDCKIL